MLQKGQELFPVLISWEAIAIPQPLKDLAEDKRLDSCSPSSTLRYVLQMTISSMPRRIRRFTLISVMRLGTNGVTPCCRQSGRCKLIDALKPRPFWNAQN
jgi:hypothetical protein